ncbi:MAG TPA: extracellular solute-binding protein [Firmicutes bacterium]|nr:extracellular solute-binding protein [Bacillota bacterium]
MKGYMRWLVGLFLVLLVIGEGTAFAEKTKILFLWPTYTQSKIRFGESLVRQFEEANPDIDVELMLEADPYAKLQVLVAGGNPPDVVWLGAGWLPYVPWFLPLDDFVRRDAAEFQTGEIIKTILDSFIWRGKLYAMPSGYQTLATFYNKERLNEAGLAYPNDNWTMSDLLRMAQAMTKDTNGDGEFDRWGVSWLYGYIWSLLHYGGQVADPYWTKIRINNPVTEKALSLWDDWQYRYKVAPVNHGTLGMIENGDIGIFASGIWLQENLDQARKFDYDLVDYPLLEAEGGWHRGTVLYPEEYAIIKFTKHPEEAWRFVKFATGRQHLTWAAREGLLVPSRLPILQSNAFIRPDKRMQVWITSAEYALQLLPHPMYSDLMNAFRQHWSQMSGANPQMSIRTGLDLIAQQMQAILDSYNAENAY